MTGELGTTNLLLGIMAAASVLEALLVIGVGIGCVIVYRRMTVLVEGLETQVAPMVVRVNGILDDVEVVTGKVKEETERVRFRTSRIVGFVRGLRVAIESMLTSNELRT